MRARHAGRDRAASIDAARDHAARDNAARDNAR